MKKPFCITFAGPVGCSKTPVAHHLSITFGWPILSNDAIRSEVIEDTLQPELDVDLYRTRAVARIKALADRPDNLIYDASHDRHWGSYLSNFADDPPYNFGVISYDLSREFYVQLLRTTRYKSTLPRVDELLADHTGFVRDHEDTIICTITDENFQNRLHVAEDAVRTFIADK